MRRFRGFRIVAAFSLAAFAAGCTGWAAKEAPPGQVVAERSPKTVRITRTDQSMLVVNRPVVEGDSVVGTSAFNGARVSVPLSDVQRMEVREVSLWKSAAAGVGVGVVALSALTVAAMLMILGSWN